MRVIDHIGVAVRSIEEKLPLYRALGIEPGEGEEVPGQKVRVRFLPVEGTRIELLEPTGDGSPIATFITRRGEGLHHLCFQVDDIRATMRRLEAEGLHLLSREPVAGAHGSLVCFVHPRSGGGVLIELVQQAGT